MYFLSFLPFSSRSLLEDTSYIKPEKYPDAICYCNFILKSIISEPAILFACVEMIDMKGTLPVGEIGKVVTLHSNIAQLSLHLKEKFGGLKKFLEKFPGIFVFGNDHQYNPHVFLRERLTLEHQRMIYRGVLPMQIILQYKKVNWTFSTCFFFISSNYPSIRRRIIAKQQLKEQLIL